MKSYYKLAYAVAFCMAKSWYLKQECGFWSRRAELYYGSAKILLDKAKKRDTKPHGIQWVKLSEREPKKEGVYLTYDPNGNRFDYKPSRWGIQDNIDTKPSFFNMSVTHWAEINEPEES